MHLEITAAYKGLVASMKRDDLPLHLKELVPIEVVTWTTVQGKKFEISANAEQIRAIKDLRNSCGPKCR